MGIFGASEKTITKTSYNSGGCDVIICPSLHLSPTLLLDLQALLLGFPRNAGKM